MTASQRFGLVSLSAGMLFSSTDAVKENKQPQRNVDGLKCNVRERKQHRMTVEEERGLNVINSVRQHPQNSGREVAFQSLRELINAFSLKAANLDNLCSLSHLDTSLHQKRSIMKTERARVRMAYGAPPNKAGGHKKAYVHGPLRTKNISEHAHKLKEKPYALNIPLK